VDLFLTWVGKRRKSVNKSEVAVHVSPFKNVSIPNLTEKIFVIEKIEIEIVIDCG